MNNLLSFPALCLGLFATLAACSSADHQEVQLRSDSIQVAASPVAFDSVAAQKYGADEYGMKKYVLAFLKRGSNRDLDSAQRSELQMAHLKNIEKMADEGKLVLAGPFFGNDDLEVSIFLMWKAGKKPKNLPILTPPSRPASWRWNSKNGMARRP